MGAEPLLRIENLRKHFPLRLGAFGERAAGVDAFYGAGCTVVVGGTLRRGRGGGRVLVGAGGRTSRQ